MPDAAPTLDQLVTAFHRRSVGQPANNAFVDFAAAFKAHPALLVQMQTEAERLNGLNAQFGGKLVQRDHAQHTRLAALNGMLAALQP